MLYERDYFKLTEEELEAVKEIKNKKVFFSTDIRSIPDFYYFNTSHFPNHMLDIHELKAERSKALIEEFKNVIENPNVIERNISEFVRQKRAYFIIASVLCRYDFGHHGAYLFPEFSLSTNFISDYLIIGMNSSGHEFIFIELENVYGSITKKDGSIGDSIRRGVKQVEDWEFWLEKNFRNLYAQFEKYRNKSESLPSEYFEFDQSRVHYVVVAGRRKDYNEVTYRKRRKLLKESGIRLLHYDNLVDCAQIVTTSGSYT